MSVIRRLTPAVLLTLLAPVVAEFLLGDFSIRKIAIALALLPLYGGGALLIREVSRRTGRGWPTMVLLAVAYSLLEEGFLTQSLFNPNYVGQRLLDYGYVPWLGTSLNWATLVLSIHVVWSIATPILIAEGVAADRMIQPWLRTPGLILTVLLFLLGCVSTVAFTLRTSPFVATPLQFLSVGALIIVTMAAAFRVGPRTGTSERLAPRVIVVFFVCLVLATGFMVAEDRGNPRVPPFVSVLIRWALEAIAAVAIVRWARMRAWRPGHYLAIATATTLTYTLLGLTAFLRGHTNLGEPTGRIDVAGQIGLAALVFLAIGVGARQSRQVTPVGRLATG
jgi:hypothetical protein